MNMKILQNIVRLLPLVTMLVSVSLPAWAKQEIPNYQQSVD